MYFSSIFYCIVLYFRPRCGFGFFSKSDFCAIFFSHFFSSSDSFFKFNLSRLQINASDACSGSLSSLAVSSAVCKKSSSGLSSRTYVLFFILQYSYFYLFICVYICLSFHKLQFCFCLQKKCCISYRNLIFYLLSSKNISPVYYMNEQKNCVYINPGTAYVVLFLFGAGKVVYMN